MRLCIDSTRLGLLIQLIGVTIILASQVVFIFRARRKYHSVRGAFLNMSYARLGGKEVYEMSKAEVNELAQKFPLANFLWDDFWFSLLGLSLTFLGLVVEII